MSYEIKQRFFEFKFKTEDDEHENSLPSFYVYDQHKQPRILNSFLSKLTIKGPLRPEQCKEFDIKTLLKE